MKLKPIYKLLLLFLLVGCIKTEKKDILEISLEYFIDQEITLSDIGEDIKYISLSSEFLFADIISIELTDSLLFIGAQGSGLLEFNKDGSFIRKIGTRGKGPGEYKFGTDFTLDEKHQRIYICDQKKILVYDFEGNLIREIKKNSGGSITFNHNRLFLFETMGNSENLNPQHNWTVLDTLGEILYSKNNTTTGFPKSNSSTGVPGNLNYQFNNKVYYWNHYNDTIFQLNDSLYEAAYLFKQNKYRLTPENSIVEENLVGNNQFYSIRFITESQHYLFINYRQYKKYHFCIYDKEENVFKHNISNENMALSNNIDGGLPFIPKQKFIVRGIEYLFHSVNAIDLKVHVTSEAFKNSTPKYPEKKRELEKLANSLNENDNPILMLVKLKE